MSNPAWPSTLPQYVEVEGLGGALAQGWIETGMEAGPPRRDRRSRGGEKETLDCVIWVTDAEETVLREFYETTLKQGTLAFDWVQPIGQAPASFEFVRPPAWSARSGRLLAYRFRLRRTA